MLKRKVSKHAKMAGHLCRKFGSAIDWQWEHPTQTAPSPRGESNAAKTEIRAIVSYIGSGSGLTWQRAPPTSKKQSHFFPLTLNSRLMACSYRSVTSVFTAALRAGRDAAASSTLFLGANRASTCSGSNWSCTGAQHAQADGELCFAQGYGTQADGELCFAAGPIGAAQERSTHRQMVSRV